MASSELDRFHAALRAARARVDPLLVTPEDGGEAASGALAELKVALDGLDAAEGLLACADPTRPTAGDGRSQRYRELFDRAPAAYVVTDSDGVITEVNRTARDLF
ncbi:MAG TPA: PAS domain S-box protein, partial [Euzebyales bacterium]|nr:PAS domain S-box protein [Euzebyales bacterium]